MLVTTAATAPSTPDGALPSGSNLVNVNHSLVRAVAVLPELGPLDARPHLGFPHLSNSQVSTLRRCGAKYYFKYGLQMREPADSNLAFGSAFHAAMHRVLLDKMYGDFDEHSDQRDAIAIAHDALDAQLAKEPSLTMKPRYRNGPPETVTTLKEGLDRAVRLASSALLASIEPIACEQGYVIYWRDGTTLPYVGYADAVVAIDDREHGILDFKTSSSEKQLLDLELDNALSAYAFGHELATGIRTRKTMYGVYVRKKEPTTTMLRSTRDETDLTRLHAVAKITTAQIRAGLYLPADTALQCGGCAFRAACQRLFGGPKLGATHA